MRILTSPAAGIFSRAFAVKGATVTGADISPELIKSRGTFSEEVNYLVASADKRTELKEKSFDAITIVLASKYQNLDGTFAECRRVLNTGGRLLPCLESSGVQNSQKSEWGFDDTAHTIPTR